MTTTMVRTGNDAGRSGVRLVGATKSESAAALVAAAEPLRGAYVISTPIFCRRFIGRQRELQFLVDLRREAAKAHGGIAMVAGDAGVGKSRLIREFLDGTNAARGRVATAQCRA